MSDRIRRIGPEALTDDTTQTPGMTRAAALARDGLWSGLVRTAPGMTSAWHRHGDHETVIYVLQGTARLDFGPAGADTIDARTGDFIHVPPLAAHRESNPLGSESVLLVTRVGSGPPVLNVEGPDA